MISCKTALLSAAVMLCLVCLRRVTAQGVSVEYLTQKPSCPNEPLILYCQLNFSSFLVRWEHTAFEEITFRGGDESVGNTINVSNGRVVANLTMKDASGDTSNVLFSLSSTLTIHPPLNKLRNISLNNTNIICVGIDESAFRRSGVASIVLDGEPSPPANLSFTSNNTPSTTIEWDTPLYRGQGIMRYIIRIPNTNYVSREANTSLTRNSHIIVGGEGSGVEYNTIYKVNVSTVGICGSESEPVNIFVMIEASAPPKPFLSVSLTCSVGSVRVNLQWQYGVSTTYTPPTDVAINGSPLPPSSKCDDLTLSDKNCSFVTATSTKYNVVMNLTNSIGTQLSNEVSFDSQPLIANDSGLNGNASFINISVNSLCQEDNYIIAVYFGVRRLHSTYCEIQQNITVISGKIVKVPSNITLGSGEKYCYTPVLSIAVINDSRRNDSRRNVNNRNNSKNSSDHFNLGLLLGVSLPPFCWYMSAVPFIAVHFYWFLPIIKRDLCRTKYFLYIIGYIFSVVVFPIGLILGSLNCNVLSKDCSHAQQKCYYTCTTHNRKMILILRCIGVVTSVIIFPLGGIALVLYYCGHKNTAEGLLRSTGIVIAVIVFPMGLGLLVASCVCLKEPDRDEPHTKKQISEMSKWVRYIICVGEVVTCHLTIWNFCRMKLAAAEEVTETIYDIPTEPVKKNRPQPGFRKNIAYGVRHAPPSIKNPAYGYRQELSCMEAQDCQEHSLAGADDSSEYDDIRNVPPDYEIVMDSRSQPGINRSRNTAHGIPQGSLTAANGRVQ